MAEENQLYLKYVDQIISAFEKECAKEYKVTPSGSGGKMPKDIEEIAVDFRVYRTATIDEARALEVAMTEKLLKKINQDEKIRPYLREYPFTANRARVGISFHNKDQSFHTDGSVAYVSKIRNLIYYDAADPKTEDLYNLRKEPYEEALKLVQK